jgi:acetolactate synthase-1/2/3 large subunit
MNGAELLCESLLANDVDVCFANPGTSEMHFVAALDRRPAIRCVLGLFEGVVTGAADGYARMSDKPACTLLHLGPGLANGLANLHNARRAFSPVVNIVGDHPAAHLPFDAPLTSDIESLARPMSNWVHRTASADDVGRDTAAAISAAMSWPRQIATLILPADAAWNETRGAAMRCSLAQAQAPDCRQVDAAASALRRGVQTTILLSGRALRTPALEIASRVAKATGARLLAQQSNGRIERGAGRVPIERVPYIVDQALATFADTEQLILVGAKAPVAFFQYPNKPSSMLPPACQVIEMAGNDVDLLAALQALAQALGVSARVPLDLSARADTALPVGRLTPEAIAQALTALMPEQAIVCDESVSSGRNFFMSTHGAQQHDFLQLTGGAIGIGLPLATGAAVACPGRKVITLQADGSAMYTAQALWTQARERLDVVTIVFANRSYAILHAELRHVGAGAPGRNARRMFDLVDPTLDWVSIAKGMGVEGARTDDARTFTDVLRSALAQRGPFLIEAVI